MRSTLLRRTRQILGAKVRRRPFQLRVVLTSEAAVFHAQLAGGQVEFADVAVVMGHRHDRHAGPVQVTQDFIVELAPKFRILVGGPFVEQKEGPLFQQADDERETLALTGGQIERAKLAVGEPRLGAQLGIASAGARPRRGPDWESRRAARTDGSR